MVDAAGDLLDHFIEGHVIDAESFFSVASAVCVVVLPVLAPTAVVAD